MLWVALVPAAAKWQCKPMQPRQAEVSSLQNPLCPPHPPHGLLAPAGWCCGEGDCISLTILDQSHKLLPLKHAWHV